MESTQPSSSLPIIGRLEATAQGCRAKSLYVRMVLLLVVAVVSGCRTLSCPEPVVCPPCAQDTCLATNPELPVLADEELAEELATIDQPEELLALPEVWPVRLGVDVLLGEQIHLLEGRRVGLVTNASGVDGDLVPTVDRFAGDTRFELVQIYAPEHGLRGALRAGQRVEDETDPYTGVHVESLYGRRSSPSPASLQNVEVLVFDIQDVGSRTYTYVSTMGESMQAAASAGITFVVLDRPNPLGGLRFEGPIREERYRSFVGWGPTPVSHGMTVGELARFFNLHLDIGADLLVVPMQGWRRDMIWEDTGLIWVPTSPNIPHAYNAHLYIATGMVAGVSQNVDEGAGYTMPFETIAAAFIDAQDFTRALQAHELEGVRLRPIVYRPGKSRFRNQLFQGVQLLLTEPRSFRPLRTALVLFTTLEALYPGQLEIRSLRSFARIWGNTGVIDLIRGGASVEEIEATWAEDLQEFAVLREEVLIYGVRH